MAFEVKKLSTIQADGKVIVSDSSSTIVTSVNKITPSIDGNITLTASDITTKNPIEKSISVQGNDNWSTTHGFVFDFKTLDPSANISNADTVWLKSITLHTSTTATENGEFYLEIENSQGTKFKSINTNNCQTKNTGITFNFDQNGAVCLGGTGTAKFIDSNGNYVDKPLRITTQNIPDQNALITSATEALNTNYFVDIDNANILIGGTITDSFTSIDDQINSKIGTTGGTVNGILRMQNPKISCDDNSSHDISLVPNAQGSGLQIMFPDGNTFFIQKKTGAAATTTEVSKKITKLTEDQYNQLLITKDDNLTIDDIIDRFNSLLELLK